MRFMIQVSAAIGAILGGYLASISFQTMLGAQIIIGWLPFFISLTLKEPKIERMDQKSHLKNFKKNDLIKLTVINWVVWSHATYFAIWMLQKYWEQLGFTIFYFGILWAIFQISAATFTKLAIVIESKLGAITCLYLIAFSPVLGYFCMYFFTDRWAVVFGLLFALSRGLTQVILIDAINSRVPDKMRASVNSLNSFILRITFIGVGPLVGFIFDHFGLQNVSLGLGIVFCLLTFTLVPNISKTIYIKKKAT